MPRFKTRPINRGLFMRVLVAVSMGLVWAGRVMAAEPPKPPGAPMLAEAVRRGWLRPRIISGRLAFYGAPLGNIDNHADKDGASERLNIRTVEGQVAADYEMATPVEKLTVALGRNRFHVRRSRQGDSGPLPVEFRQAPHEPLRLIVGLGEGQQAYQAATLWHLFIAEPDPCRQHLAPLLRLLGEEWDVSRSAVEVEATLIRQTAAGEIPDLRRWAALVGQLADDRFGRREAADRELRALGRVVLTYLGQLDSSQLDAEQHYRVRRIIMTLSASSQNDRPSEAAAWLAVDPAIWVTLLGRENLSTRRLAAERLKTLLGKPIPFDPAAEPAARASQIQRLRAQIVDD